MTQLTLLDAVLGALVVALLAIGLTILQAQRKKAAELASHNQALQQEKAEAAQTQVSLQEQLQALQLQHQQSETRLEALSRRSEELQLQLRENSERSEQTLLSERRQFEGKLERLQQEHQALLTRHTQTQTELAERDASHARQVADFEKQKEALAREFENLANRIFEEKGKRFSETSQASLDGLLKPFREQISAFQHRVNEVHAESIKGNATLDAEIKKVLEIGLKMSEEAGNLTSALKGDAQQRGAWGEAQLERTLEMSGLVEQAHYEKQTPFKDAEGRQKYTDYIIKLPDNKQIIIDSKVSLLAYDKAVGAKTPEEERVALDEHVRAVKAKIDDLAGKDYTNLIGVRSPSFVLMFIPVEPAYIEALKHHKDLFSYGYEKGIVLVSHTTLIPILRTVANLWMLERSNVEAREISERAGEIYNQVCLVAERLHKLGATLGTASNHYNNTVKALVGQQGLYGKVERFNRLSSKVSKTMPALEPAHLDFETERLEMVAQPVSEALADAASQSSPD